jgi:hypothetical protein
MGEQVMRVTKMQKRGDAFHKSAKIDIGRRVNKP